MAWVRVGSVRVLERLYDALYEAQRHPGIEFEVLRANIEEIAKEGDKQWVSLTMTSVLK